MVENRIMAYLGGHSSVLCQEGLTNLSSQLQVPLLHLQRGSQLLQARASTNIPQVILAWVLQLQPTL